MPKQSVQKNVRLSPDFLQSLATLANEEGCSVNQYIVKCARTVSSLNRLQGMQKKKEQGYTTLEAIKRATHAFVEE